MIETNIESLRDTFALVEDGVYYAYGTGVTAKDWNHYPYSLKIWAAVRVQRLFSCISVILFRP